VARVAYLIEFSAGRIENETLRRNTLPNFKSISSDQPKWVEFSAVKKVLEKILMFMDNPRT